MASPNAARPVAMTSCFVLPASVTTVWRPMAGAMIENNVGYCESGTATSTMSAVASSDAQSSSSVYATSTMPQPSASSRLRRPRPTPMIRDTAPAARSASAHEPPISPTPTTTSVPIRTRGMLTPTLAPVAAALPPEGAQFAPWGGPAALITRSRRKCDSERGEKALILGGKPDGHAQPLRQSIVSDRAHDHALAQQRFVDTRAVADIDQHEVPARRQRAHVELA